MGQWWRVAGEGVGSSAGVSRSDGSSTQAMDALADALLTRLMARASQLPPTMQKTKGAPTAKMLPKGVRPLRPPLATHVLLLSSRYIHISVFSCCVFVGEADAATSDYMRPWGAPGEVAAHHSGEAAAAACGGFAGGSTASDR